MQFDVYTRLLRPFNPDDDILVENVWFLLIVYTPLFIFFSLVYTSFYLLANIMSKNAVCF